MHLVSIILSLTFSLSGADAVESWPQFRGPNATGRANAADPPIEWSESKNVRWKTAIHGKGWSSPVIWANQIWLTTAPPDGHQFFAMCIDRTTGKVVYDIKVFEVANPEFCHPFNSYASPTPVIEEGRVYVHFGTYGTACLDTATGKILWTRNDLHCDHFRGPGSSPIVFENLLIVQFDGIDRQFLVALNKKSGSTVWQRTRDIDYGTDNGDKKKAYATPTVIEVNGQPQLISPAAMATIAYEPRTGQEIWRVLQGGMNVAQPPQFGLGKLFLCTGDGGFRFFALRPDGHGDVTSANVEWKHSQAMPSRCAPVLVDDLLFLVNETGIASCLEAKTGKVVWQHRLSGQFSASPVYAAGRLYYCSLEGSIYVLAAGRDLKVLATNHLDDGFMSTPAIVGKAIYLRTKTHLYRIENK